MTSSKLAIAATLLITSLSAHAWKGEPKSVLGVKIGRPFIESQIRKCPGGWNPDPIEGLCYVDTPLSDPNTPSYYINQHPFEYAYVTILTDRNGAVAEVTFNLPHAKFQHFLEVLIERYGKPTANGNRILQNKYGAQFSNETFIWSGKSLSILAIERHNNQKDQSFVTFSTNEALLAPLLQRKNDVKSKAGSL